MKFFLKSLPFFLISLMFFSCEKEILEDSTVNITKEDTFQKSSSSCSISVDNEGAISIGSERVFSVTHDQGDNESISWSVFSGLGMQVIGSSNQSDFRVRFLNGFNQGVIRVVVGDCDLRITVNKNTGINNGGCNRLPTPAPIYSQFLTPVPSGYIEGNLGGNYLCTGTIANELSVPFDSCATYSWSITPAGSSAGIYPSGNSAIVVANHVGRYRVTLITRTDAGQRTEQFLIYAENCDGGGIGIGGF